MQAGAPEVFPRLFQIAQLAGKDLTMLLSAHMADAGRVAARLLFALLIALFLPRAAAEHELRPLPPELRALTDEVGALSLDERQRLSQALEDVRDRTGVPVVMVITETTAPETIEDYTERLALRWRRERHIRPEGSIFVILAVGDQMIRAMPGQDLAALDRAFARPGAFGDVVPLLADGRYFEGLMNLGARIYEMLKEQQPRLPGDRRR